MSEKILKFVLSVIPTILLVVCVVVAFATHGWDVQRTLFAEDPQEIAKGILPSEIGAEEEFLNVTDSELSEDGTLTLEVELHWPLNVPVKIKELSVEAILDGNTVPISLLREVEVPAKGSARFKMEGKLPMAQTQMPPILPLEEKPTANIRNMKMTLDFSGIVLEIEESGLGGAD